MQAASSSDICMVYHIYGFYLHFYYCKSQANARLTYHTLRVVDDGFYNWKTIMGFRWNTKWFNFFMFWAKHKPWSLKQGAFRADRYKWNEMGNPYEKWPYEWATAVITLISGVTSLFITCRGPPCTIFSERSCKQWLACWLPCLKYCSYCWWKKFCTTWDVQNFENNGIKLPINWCRVCSVNSSSKTNFGANYLASQTKWAQQRNDKPPCMKIFTYMWLALLVNV